MAKHRSILGPGEGQQVRKAPPSPAAGPRTVDMPPLSLRAEISLPSTLNDEAREVDLTWTTGADVERYDWSSDKRYIERLSLEPAAVRLERLNAGGPLLDSHSAWSVADMLGAVIPGSVTMTKNQGRARVRFSKRAEVDGVWQDVKDGIVRSVSVGYRIYKYEETEAKGNKLPVRLATDWEPYEISMVPMPADAGAATRGQQLADTNRCEIVPANLSTRAQAPSGLGQPRAAHQEEKAMDPEKDNGADMRSEYVVEDPAPPPSPAAVRGAATPADEPNERDLGAVQERERVQGIITACRAARLPLAFSDKLIADPKMTLVRAQSAVFAEMSKRGREDAGPSPIPSGTRIEFTGDDPLVHKRKGIEEALLHRAAPDLKREGKPVFALTDLGREYRGMGLMEVARTFLAARGVRTTGMSKMDLAAAAFGFTHRSMHTTSDFPELLADVQGKVLRAAYDEAPQTWRALARDVILSDFKPSKQLQFGEAPQLLEILEHGEYKSGTIGEGKEQFALASYGRKFAITRKALINDDTDAFSRVPIEFGRSARRLESDLAWLQITSNPVMGDGTVLFHTDHSNLAGSGAAISVESIGAGRAALRKQTGVDGASLLNLSARYIVVPASKETLADQYTSANYVAAQAGNVNPFAGRLTPVAEPRLDEESSTAWYLSADPSQIDILLHGTLEGQDGPRVESRVGFDVDGVEIKCGIDTAFKAGDWRGLYKNPGA